MGHTKSKGLHAYGFITSCDWVIYVHITIILRIVIQQFNFSLFISIAPRLHSTSL